MKKIFYSFAILSLLFTSCNSPMEDIYEEIDAIETIISGEATITLTVDKKEKTGKGKGVGPVDAVSHAIRTMIDPSITLKEYKLKAITGGTNALADVAIKVQDNKGNIFKAEAVNEDIIMASAIALIEGMNKALNFQRNKQKKRIHAQD